MLNTLFNSVIGTLITLQSFLLCMAAALILGYLSALIYSFRNTYTKSFLVTLASLPAIVAVVIMMVNGNVGAGVAVAGTFSLVRFRSAQGTAREIGAIFLSMAIGLACGMGYIGFACLFTLIMALAMLVYTFTNFGGRRNEEMLRQLRITVPEDLEYGEMFEDIFSEYTTEHRLLRVKTTNLGSLNRLTYEILLKKANTEKALIDALRVRNGNLEISCGLLGDDAREL